MDTTKATTEDIYEFKSTKETDSPPDNKITDSVEANAEVTDSNNPAATQSEENQKRNFSEVADSIEDSGNDEETKRKKRKDETAKDVKGTTPQRTSNQVKSQTNKQATIMQTKSNLLNATKNGKH